MRHRIFALIALLSVAGWLQAAQAPDLQQIMADPDWIGPPVEEAWWSLDGAAVFYQVKQSGAPVRDIHRLDLDSGDDQVLEPAPRARIDGPQAVFDSSRDRAVFIRDGDVFIRYLADGDLRQITRTAEAEREAHFSADGQRIHFQRNGDWWIYDLSRSLSWPATQLKWEPDPLAETDDELARMQLRLFATLQQQRDDQIAQRNADADRANGADTQPPHPWYLGAEYQALGSALSPDGRWLAIAVARQGGDEGQGGKMPHYVTASGYVDVEDVRTRVGRNVPATHALWLLDLEKHEKHAIDWSSLPGIKDQPLAFLDADDETERDEAQGRAVSIDELVWNRQGTQLAVQIHSVDNKDRWLATLDPAQTRLTPRHRLSDDAWINWLFNELGWMPDGETLWFMSEDSGYSHFYTLDLEQRKPRQLTQGDFEVMSPWIDPTGEFALVITNRNHPTEYDVFRLSLDDGDWQQVTELRGVESFVPNSTGEQAIVRWSSAYTPPQISIVTLAADDNTPAVTRQLTDTRTNDYRAIDWQQPQYVAVPSSHGAEQPIWSKFYPPRGDHEGPRPIVLFVHGAGYTQNTHHKFPYYFREQMFHNLLSQKGYLVLDMDYRASRGYGRDWRTAIYRQMGHPELEDLLDGVNWLVEEHNGDAGRVGVYGGSYGGFMSLMALFRTPKVFKAGAALRPVTDWAHYNHGYTANILNTPEQDPGAYRKSSPIEHAEHLQGHLLIAHGMLDDNVFYQDSVRLAQRLIELEKDNWELASYPMERHSFVHASSWLDEYRRIWQLFERTIGDQP